MDFQQGFWRQIGAAQRRAMRLLGTSARLFQGKAEGGPKRRSRCGEEGQSLVEFALTLPILLGFIFGLFQVCMAFYSSQYISELAREGTRFAIFHGPNCTTSAGASCTATATQVGAYVTGLKWPNLGGGTVSVDTAVGDMYPSGEVIGKPVVVTVTYIFPYKIPFVSSQTLTLKSSSQMTILQ
jgi:Flp pilus assembly protein TadG